MKFLKLSVLILALNSGLIQGQSQNEATISSQELMALVGNWQGSLTYLDYSSGEPYSMPANISFEKGKNEFELKYEQVYPNEPKANSKGTYKISKDGKEINGDPLVSKTIEDGKTVFVVEYPGKDGNDNKEATIRLTYTIGKDSFSNRKDVQFKGEERWIKRNEYSYSRK